jgi:hypothetical protein
MAAGSSAKVTRGWVKTLVEVIRIERSVPRCGIGQSGAERMAARPQYLSMCPSKLELSFKLDNSPQCQRRRNHVVVRDDEKKRNQILVRHLYEQTKSPPLNFQPFLPF